jgi:hypothetical protein
MSLPARISPAVKCLTRKEYRQLETIFALASKLILTLAASLLVLADNQEEV